MKAADVRVGGRYMTMIGGQLAPVIVTRAGRTRPISGIGRVAFYVRFYVRRNDKHPHAPGPTSTELPKARTAAALRLTRAQAWADAITAWGAAIAARGDS